MAVNTECRKFYWIWLATLHVAAMAFSLCVIDAVVLTLLPTCAAISGLICATRRRGIGFGLALSGVSAATLTFVASIIKFRMNVAQGLHMKFGEDNEAMMMGAAIFSVAAAIIAPAIFAIYQLIGTGICFEGKAEQP